MVVTASKTSQQSTEKGLVKNREFGYPWSKCRCLLLIVVAVLGMFTTTTSGLNNQCRGNPQQAEGAQQGELFSEVKLHLGSADPKQRTAAIAAISDYAKRSTESSGEAVKLIMLELQTETDPAALKASIQVLPQFGAPALSALVQKNKEIYERLARSTGRILGIKSVLQRINVAGQPTPDELMAVYLFKQLPVEVARTVLPWQEGADSEISFFQTPDQLAIQPGFRTAFEQASKSSHATRQEEMDSENEFHSSIRDLWVNTQAIAILLTTLSGKLDGISLRRTILLRPQLAGADLRGIDARSAIWMAPVLTGADLSFANLSKAKMKYADLRNANMTGADLGQVDFGRTNRGIESRTSTELRLVQKDIILNGTNLWEMANCYLKDQSFDPAKLQIFKDQRQKVLAKPDAKEYLAKSSNAPADD